MADPVDRWWSLPEHTRTQVLTLLAALIARGVLLEPAASAPEPIEVDEVVDDE